MRLISSLRVIIIIIIIGGVIIIIWGGPRPDPPCLACRKLEILTGIVQVVLGAAALVGLNKLGRQAASNSLRSSSTTNNNGNLPAVMQLLADGGRLFRLKFNV